MIVEQDLRLLPASLIVAFAVRCAARVEPCARSTSAISRCFIGKAFALAIAHARGEYAAAWDRYMHDVRAMQPIRDLLLAEQPGLAAGLDARKHADASQSPAERARRAQAACLADWAEPAPEEHAAVAAIRAAWCMYAAAWADTVTACTTHPEHYEDDLPVFQAMANDTRVGSAVDACADATLVDPAAEPIAQRDLGVLTALTRDSGVKTVDPLETGPLGPLWGTAAPRWFDRLDYTPVDESRLRLPLDFRNQDEPIVERHPARLGPKQPWWKLL